MISEDSPLRHPPPELSRRQVQILDGIRYAADMASVAYDRLRGHLQSIARMEAEPTVKDISIGMLDAWSLVDSAHRFRDLVANLPGLPNSPWKRLLAERTRDVAELRNSVQHQLGELEELQRSGGSLWGYLSWRELAEGRATGRWHMVAAGSTYPGDRWLFMGPVRLPFVVPRDRVRLNAFGKQVYLARTLAVLQKAVGSLETELESRKVRPVGEPAGEGRGADAIMSGSIEVARAISNARRGSS